MHAEVMDYLSRFFDDKPTPQRVLEIGSRNLNGSPRSVLQLAAARKYVGIDLRPGPGVDVVADGATWKGDGRLFDVVVCCEVLEHAINAPEIIGNAFSLLRPGGHLVVTAASTNREQHSGVEADKQPTVGEYYQNISPASLLGWLSCQSADFGLETGRDGQDVYGWARAKE
jgi:hypothetical protein